jgi:hypothetical protein
MDKPHQVIEQEQTFPVERSKEDKKQKRRNFLISKWKPISDKEKRVCLK